MIHECRCGNFTFYFIGVQTFPFEPFFMNLYNCYECNTTVSIPSSKKDHATNVRAASVSSIVGSKAQHNYVKTDDVSFFLKK